MLLSSLLHSNIYYTFISAGKRLDMFLFFRYVLRPKMFLVVISHRWIVGDFLKCIFMYFLFSFLQLTIFHLLKWKHLLTYIPVLMIKQPNSGIQYKLVLVLPQYAPYQNSSDVEVHQIVYLFLKTGLLSFQLDLKMILKC